MNEADHKRKLVAEINAIGGQARRFEDKFAVGLLDLGIKLPGHPFFWAEGKIIRGNLFAPTPSQFEEGKKWETAGVRVLLIGWKDREMAISPWVKQTDIRDCFIGPASAVTLRGYLDIPEMARKLKPEIEKL